MAEAYSPKKIKSYYSIRQVVRKIFFKFNKKRKFLYDLFYLTFTLKPYHFVSAHILKIIFKFLNYDFYNNNIFLRFLLFTGIRSFSEESIFNVREKYFYKISKNDKNIEEKYKDIILKIRKDGICDISELINLNDNDI